MNKLILLFLLPGTITGFSQSLKKYSIGQTGCSYYNYCNTVFDVSHSPDSSVIYTGACELSEVTYGIICVQLRHPENDLQVAENLVISYLDFLKTSFDITKSVGYGKGHRLNESEQTRGILDYWLDKSQQSWKIKGWTDGSSLTVLYAFSKKELPEQRVNVFLNGFRLPEK